MCFKTYAYDVMDGEMYHQKTRDWNFKDYMTNAEESQSVLEEYWGTLNEVEKVYSLIRVIQVPIIVHSICGIFTKIKTINNLIRAVDYLPHFVEKVPGRNIRSILNIY